jgi:hypothetical protein
MKHRDNQQHTPTSCCIFPANRCSRRRRRPSHGLQHRPRLIVTETSARKHEKSYHSTAGAVAAPQANPARPNLCQPGRPVGGTWNGTKIKVLFCRLRASAPEKPSKTQVCRLPQGTHAGVGVPCGGRRRRERNRGRNGRHWRRHR